MYATEAAQIINTVTYKPEWTFHAEPHTKRFEESIRIDVIYQARNSDRDKSPFYLEWIDGGARASFTLMVGDIPNRDELARHLINDVIMVVELHEAREFLRWPDTNDAPFHPHRLATMEAWGDREADLAFGLS